MKCHNCGTEAQSGDKFCLKCGTELKAHAPLHEGMSANHHTATKEHVLVCPHCGKENQVGDKFCMKCGKALEEHATHTVHHAALHTSENVESSVSLPAEQAEKLLNDAQKLVQHLSSEEKVMGGASIVALLAFFMPWSFGGTTYLNGFSMASNNGWYFLLPLFLLCSLAILYFSQGSKQNSKIFLTTFQATIGMYVFGLGISVSSYSQFGLWLMILSGGVLTGTALYFQKKILLK